MSKKTSNPKAYGKLHDPNFVMPETKDSLQEEPVDFRAENPKAYGRLHDPDFFMPGEREKFEAKKLQKSIELTEQDQLAQDILFPIKTSEKDAQARVALIDQEKLKLENELADVQNEIKKRNTIGKIIGTDPNFEYEKQLQQQLEVLKDGRNRLFAEDKDVAEIDRELNMIEKELADISKQRQNMEATSVAQARTVSGFGAPTNIQEKVPGDLGELRNKEADLEQRKAAFENKRKQLEYAATPVSPRETLDIEINWGQNSGNIKNQDLITKYGEDKVNRVLRKKMNFVYGDIAGKHVEQQIDREDYGNMLTGEYAMYVGAGGSKAPKVSPEMRTKADSLFTQVLKTPEYQEANLMGKRKLLAKAIKEESVKDIPTGEDVDADAAKKKALADELEMTTYMAQRMMYNDKGDNLSLNGLQMMAEYINGDMVDRRIELENQKKSLWAADRKNPNYSPEERHRLDQQYGAENVGLYMEQVEKELKTINDALLYNKQILDMNPQESKFRQFQSGLTSTPTRDLLSAGITEMSRMLNIADIAEKATTGEIGWTESKILETYAMMNMANGSDELKHGRFDISPYGIGKGISIMIPYMTSFLATNPVYLAGKAGTKYAVKGAARTVKKNLQREIIGDTKILLSPKLAKVYGKEAFSPIEFAGRMIARTGGVSAQTMASQPMLQTAIAKETMPNVQMTFEPQYNDMFARIEALSPEELKEGKRKAYSDSFFELFTEQMGPYIMKSLKGAGVGMSSMEAFKRYNLSKLIAVKKAGPAKGFNKFVKQRLGWHGMAEEYFEELANYFTTTIANKEQLFDDGFFAQQLETLATVAIFGAAMKGVNVKDDWQTLRFGDKVRFKVTGFDGKTNNVYLTNTQNDELKEVFHKSENFDEDLTNWLYENKNDLTPKQVAFVMRMAANKKRQDGAEDVIKAAGPYSDLATAGDDLAAEEAAKKPKQSLADEIIEKSGVEDTAIEDDAESAILDPQKRKEYGLEPLRPTFRGTTLSEWESIQEGGIISSDNMQETTWVSDQKEYSDEYVNSKEDGVLIEFKPEAIDKSVVESGQPNDNTGVRLGKGLTINDVLRVTDAKGNVIYDATQAVQQEIPFEETVTEGTSDPEGTMEISETEAKAIEKHNAEITKQHPELAEAGLLITMPGGQLELPTYEELLDRAEEMSEELQDITTQDEQGNMRINTEYAQSMLKQFDVLNKELNRRAKSEGIPFDFLMPSERHHQLTTELKQGKEITGNVTARGNKIMTFRAEDGRQVKAIIPPGNEKAKAAADKAVLNQTTVSLKRKKGKLMVMSEGTEIGFVEEFNRDYELKVGEKQAELSLYIDDQLEMAKRLFRRAQGTLPSGIPLTSDHAEALKHLIKVIKYFIKKGITNVELIVQKIKERIRASEAIDATQKLYWNDLLNKNINLIEALLKEQAVDDQAEFNPEQLEIDFDNPDAAFLSGEQKKNIHLKTFNDIWKPVAEASGSSVTDVERQFHFIARDPAFDGVSNDATYQAFLQTYQSNDPMMKSLLNLLSKRPFSEIVSAFDFYRNARITKQVGILIQDNGKVSIKTLNPSENYQDFVNKFHTAVKNYQYKQYRGYEAIRMELRNYGREGNAIRDNMPDTLEERTAVRKKRHEDDLNMLAKITGITPQQWDAFFEDKQGIVRTASTTRETITNKEFPTYQELLEADTYYDRKYRIQGSMMATIIGKAFSSKTTDSFKDALNTHFLRGKGDSLSNLYQLLTANEDQDELGLSGIDIKRDRFNSFIQFSHLFDMAERLGREVSVLNGLHNRDVNEEKRGSHSAKMSVADIWFSLAHLYATGKDTYQQHMGQFGDKSTLFLIETDKIKPTEEDYARMRKDFPGFEDAVQYFFEEIIAPKGETFLWTEKGEKMGPAADQPGANMKEQRMNFAREFVYNYATAMPEINADFHGEVSQYKDGLIGMFKRGGSTNSPGYRLNPNIEGGVGKTYRVLVVNDDPLKQIVHDKNGDPVLGKDGKPKRKTLREPDGLSVGSGDFFQRIAVSMGEIYAQTKKLGMLTSVKALHSNVKNGKRGLMKTNNINIDALEMKHKDSHYKKMKDYMQKHNIDMITFTSGNKLTEEEGYEPMEMFSEDGKFIAKAPSKGQILERSTSDLYIQQDLRHSTTPKATKMPSQMMANAITLPNGNVVSELVFNIQMTALNEIEAMLRAKGVDNVRLEWINEAISEFSHPDIYRMLKAGVGINEPSIRNMLRTILSSQVSKYALDVPINRVTQQEIPDIDGVLKGREEFTDKNGIVRVRLPEIAANIQGARAQWDEFVGNIEGAIAHVMANKAQYWDLFDRDGKLMEWEITGRGGAIPGEPVVSTRVPADDLHSHTVARLRYNWSSQNKGNFTMLDNKSRVASGSDFDGDARFNQVLFKTDKGNSVNSNTKEGLSNQILMEMVYGYSEPGLTDRINSEVDPDAYNPIVAKRRKDSQEPKWDEKDLRAYMKAWERNKVGVDMKGILTDMNTLFSIASQYQIQLKGFVPHPTRENHFLQSFINDEYGQMKRHIANLLNMAFDNAKDPKIEDMGLNEVTVNMFMLGLMTDPALNSGNFKSSEAHYDAIYKAIETQTEYFTTPMMVDFVRRVRRQNGGLERKESKKVWEAMRKEYQGKENELKKFYNLSQELPEIRNFYRLVQKAPKNSVELQMAYQLLNKINKNKFELFDSKNFFYSNTLKLKKEFEVIPRILDFVQNQIFFDAIESTDIGRDIVEYLLGKWQAVVAKERKMKNFDEEFGQSQYESIAYLMNNVLAVLTVNPTKSYVQVRREAMQVFKENELSGNLFFQYLQVLPKKEGPSLEIAPEFKNAAINAFDLKKIHQAWDALDQDVKDKLLGYVFHRFGTTSSRMGGSFYSLISDKEKIRIAEENQKQINDWTDGFLSPEKQYNIAKLIMAASKDSEIQKLWGENQYDARNYNVNVADPSTDTHLDYDALESVQGAIDRQSKDNWVEEYGLPGLSKAEFAEMMKKALGVKYNETLDFNRHIIPWAKKIVEARDAEINYFKNTDEQINDQELKDMVSEDVIGEALASDDPAIQEFILERMQAMYPEVEFFKDKDKFFDFLRKNGARLHNISPSALGHALGNAVYADPTQAVQSTILHEYAHVYWDALPKDHYTKKQLLRHFRSLPGNKNLPERLIEEQIIMAIGRSAFNIAEAGYNQTFTQKFADLLRNFWAAVKRFFGGVTQENLVNEMAQALWLNQDQIKPQTITGQRVMKNMAESEMSAHLSGNGKYYKVGGKPFARVSKVSDFVKERPFNEEGHIKDQVQKIADKYFRDNGQALPVDQEILAYHDVAAKLEASRRATSLIKAITYEIFGGEPVSKEQIKESFTSMDQYHVLRKTIADVRRELLKKYPDAEFETNQITYSKTYEIAGTIDLRLKLGNGKYVLIKVQATKFPYMVGPNKFHDYYTKSWGSLKAPLEEGTADDKKTENAIQAKLYAAMEESLGREVQEVFILPIVKTSTEDGRLQTAWVANRIENKPLQNMVPVSWRDREGKLIKSEYNVLTSIAKAYQANKKKNQAKPISNEEAMIANQVKPTVAAAQVVAEAFLAESTASDFKNMSYKDIESLLSGEAHFGLEGMISKLHALGYTTEDIRGVDHIEMKYLFFLAHEDVSKEEWESHKDKYISKVKVGTKFIPVPNENNTGQTKYHLEIGSRQLYMEESGHGTLEKNDEIAQIVETIDDTGQKHYKAYYFTVLSTNTRYGKIRALDQNSGEIVVMQSVDAASGTMKLIDEDASIPKDSYEPKYFKKIEDDTREQYQRLNQKATQMGDLEYKEYEDRMLRIDAFLNRNNTLEKLRKAMGNHQKMIGLHQSLHASDFPQINHFNTFMQEVLTAHYLAEQVRYEAEFMKLNEIKPAILSIYFFFNADENNDKTMFRFDSPLLTRLFAPDRIIGGRHVPLHFVRRGVVDAYMDAFTAQIEIREKLNPYLGKINHDNVVEKDNESPFYKNPNTAGLSKEEKEFLSIVYEYHYKYNVHYNSLKRSGKTYPRRVRVSGMFMTKGEMVEAHGRRFGKIMKKLMMPSPYDEIEIDEIYIDEFGRYEKTGGKTTFRKQKDAFAYIKGNDTHNREWLGSRWRHFASTGLKNVISPGILKYYQREALREYEAIKKSDPTILRKQKTIPTAGRGNPKYRSRYFSEAEEKAIEGLIFEHHMGPVIGVAEHMMAQAQGKSDVVNWIKDYMDAIIYRNPNDFVSEGWRRFINNLIRLNSLAKMAFQMKVQVRNYAIGVGMNTTRETRAFVIGSKRFAASFFNPKAEIGFWKVVNIMKKTNLIMHMADDPKFDQLERMNVTKSRLTGKVKTQVPFWSKLVNAGYAPMTFFENMIQIPLLMGLMTESEFAAYDIKGNVINPANMINRSRRHELRESLRGVHGDYGPLNAAQFWHTALGGAAFQFRKWGTAMIDKEFATYEMDSNYKVRSGILTTLRLFTVDRFIWNLKGDKRRQAEYEKLLAKAEASNQFDKVFFKGTQEYLNHLIVEHGKGKLRYKHMSVEDKRKLLSAAVQIATLIFHILNKLIIGDDDDDNKFTKYLERDEDKSSKLAKAYIRYIRKKRLAGAIWNKFMNRYGADLYFMFATNQWEYIMQSPAALTGLIGNILLFSRDFAQWASGIDDVEIKPFAEDPVFRIHSNNGLYEKDSRYAREGWPKWMISLPGALPAGSQARSMLETGLFLHDYVKVYDLQDVLKEFNWEQEKIDALIESMDQSKYSRADIQVFSKLLKSFKSDMALGAKARGIEEKLDYLGEDSTPRDVQNIMRSLDYLKSEVGDRKDLAEAITMMAIIQHLLGGDASQEQIDEVIETLKAAEKQKEIEGVHTDRSQKRNYEEQKSLLEEMSK